MVLHEKRQPGPPHAAAEGEVLEARPAPAAWRAAARFWLWRTLERGSAGD